MDLFSRITTRQGMIEEEVKIAALYGPRTSQHVPIWEKLRDANPVQCDIGHQSGSYGYDYGFEVMRNVLAISDLHLQSFSVNYIYNEYKCTPPRPFPHGLYPATFLKMSPLDLKYTCNAFRHFRKISLGLNWEIFHYSGAIKPKLGMDVADGAYVEVRKFRRHLPVGTQISDRFQIETRQSICQSVLRRGKPFRDKCKVMGGRQEKRLLEKVHKLRGAF